LHQYPAFPGNGWVDETGTGAGKGYNICIPLPAGSGDDLFLRSVEFFNSIVTQFKPDVVGISAGFDAHYADPLLQLNVSATAFYKAGKLLSSQFKNLFAVLEGGYNIEELPKCVFNFLDGVNGKPIRYCEEETVSPQNVVSEFHARLQMLTKNILGQWKF
jgi:acetoin utilization deacetylase AcuC-like enzyme